MKQIIDGKLYDTEKAEEIHRYVTKYGVLGTKHYEVTLYQTKEGAYFAHVLKYNFISVVSEDEVKGHLGKYNPDKYIELFGEVEEA